MEFSISKYDSNYPRDIPYDYVSVQVHFGVPATTAPEPYVDEHTPNKGIAGVPVAHQTSENSSTAPEVGIKTPAVGLDIKGFFNRGQRRRPRQQHCPRNYLAALLQREPDRA